MEDIINIIRVVLKDSIDEKNNGDESEFLRRTI